jgi:hypothetical protein
MLPWNTCGDTQGLVRRPVQPSSIECNFMSRRTLMLSHALPVAFEGKQDAIGVLAAAEVRPDACYTVHYSIQ